MRAKLLGVMMFAWMLMAMVSISGEVLCAGTYKGHLQGIALDDDNNFYWSFTTTLIKSDARGKEMARITTPYHSGDLTWHAGKIYMAVANGRWNTEGGGANSFVHVHDGQTLALLSRHAIPEAIYGAGGVEYYDGRFFIIGGLPKGYQENYVYEYTDSFKFVKQHAIQSGYTSVGIQTICRGADGNWLFGCYGDKTGTLQTDGAFKLLGKHAFDTAIGIARTSDKGVLWVASTKKNDQGVYTGSARRVKVATILAE